MSSGVRLVNPFAPSTRLPDVVETDSESAWAQFHDLAARHDAGFAATVHSPLADAQKQSTDAAQVPEHEHAHATLDQVMVEARRLNRVCPLPMQWIRFYALLPDRRPGVPPPPMHGRTWDESSPLGKRMVLRDQIEWAAARGGLDIVLAYLRSLREEDWHHMGE